MGGSINQQVVNWARGKIGQHVGRGECWDFADRALRSAGASSSTTTGAHDDYIWGTQVSLTNVIPGDILQFRDYVVATKTTIAVTFIDGGSYVDTQDDFAKRPHHTAIVEAVTSRALVVLEQHVKPLGPRVQKHTVPIIASGPTVTTTSKMMKTGSGVMKPARVVTTVTVTIRGTIRAYRPQEASGTK
jgi:hypothetical protein